MEKPPPPSPPAAGAGVSGDDRLSVLAGLIFPLLAPSSLAAAALSCRAFAASARTVTAARAADASRGLEPFPIPFLNSVDSVRYADFLYTPHSLAAAAVEGGCGCVQCGEDCPCAGEEVGAEGIGALWECGDCCPCGSGCENRILKGAVGVRVAVVRDGRKGWGLHAAENVTAGQFVCEYAGEYLTTGEANKRQSLYDKLAVMGKLSPALIVVREHLPSGKACLRFNIDATKTGNIARFINHSCDGGNLEPVLVRASGSLFPRLCFFGSMDIPHGQELTFSYGNSRIRPNGLTCYCGSDCCHGTLPSEET